MIPPPPLLPYLTEQSKRFLQRMQTQETMIALPDRFRKHGFSFTLISRLGDVVLLAKQKDPGRGSLLRSLRHSKKGRLHMAGRENY